MSDDLQKFQDGAERRTAHRAQVAFDLNVDVSGENVFYTGLLKDISTGGVFVASDNVSQVGTVFKVRFQFPGMDVPVECTAEVKWVKDRYAQGTTETGMGLQFTDLPEDLRTRINSYIQGKDVLMYEEGF